MQTLEHWWNTVSGALPILFFFLLLGVLAVILLVSLPPIFRRRREKRQEEEEAYDLGLRTLPYEVNRDFLTPAERRFFLALQTYIDGRLALFAKVNLRDVFKVSRSAGQETLSYFNRINRKHVDFLLCDRKTFLPLCGVELDDSTHQQAERRERDKLVDRVYDNAGLALWHAAIEKEYTYDYFEDALGFLFEDEEEEDGE